MQRREEKRVKYKRGENGMKYGGRANEEKRREKWRENGVEYE